jgi:hypothetical protein
MTGPEFEGANIDNEKPWRLGSFSHRLFNSAEYRILLNTYLKGDIKSVNKYQFFYNY